jgi:hypothetical protein
MALHFVIIKNDNGKPVRFPLKRWVREHFNELPEGIYPDQTTHDLRRQLDQQGWRLNITPTEVFVIRPDENGSFEYANDLIAAIQDEDNAETIENEEALEMTFTLERDLQAALRKNIDTLEKGLVITRCAIGI